MGDKILFSNIYIHASQKLEQGKSRGRYVSNKMTKLLKRLPNRKSATEPFFSLIGETNENNGE